MNKKIYMALLCTSILSAEIDLRTCTGCHGNNFEKHAMGKSKIVSEMNKKEIVKALLGYKNGTYGGNLKPLMKLQVSKYTDEELSNINIGKSSFTPRIIN